MRYEGTVTDKEKNSRNDPSLKNSEAVPSQPAEGINAPMDASAEAILVLRSSEETQSMLHRFQVHQIELEAQNQRLNLSQLVPGEPRAACLELYDFGSVGCFTVSEEGWILQANMAAAKLLGVSRDKLCSQFFSSFVIEEDRARYFMHCKQIVEVEEPYSYELRMVKSDGTQFWAHLVVSAAQDADGVQVYRVVLSNISESKMAVMALRESEQFKQAVLDSVSFQIAVLNQDGTIVSVNEAWRKFTFENSNVSGQAAEHTQIGSNYLDICLASLGDSSEGASEAHAGVLSVLNGELPRFSLDYACHSPSQQRWFTLFVTPIAEKADGVVITHVDITASKMAEENIAQYRDAQVREVHHRIKNNLQGVAGLLQRELGKFMGFDPRLTAAISQVHAIAIVHGLQAGHPGENICLCDTISHICAMVSELAQNPIRFRIECERSFIAVQIDSNEAASISLVLNELILNAVKHSPEGSGTSVVSVEADGTSARVRIRNVVTGVPDFNIDTGRGLGTGLSLVQALLPKVGAHLAYELDPRGFMLASLCLTAPVVMAAIQNKRPK